TPHGTACLHKQLGDLSRHWGGQAAGTRIVALPRSKRIDLGQPPIFPRQKYTRFITVIEDGGAAADAVEHNRQAAVGPALASGADRLLANSQQPIPVSRCGDDCPLRRSVTKNDFLPAFSAQPPPVDTSPRRIGVVGAGGSGRGRRGA